MDPVTVSTTIDRPREEVFAYLLDVANRPEYTDHYLVDWRLTREETVGRGAGARFRFKAPLNRFNWADITLIEVEAPRRIVEAGRGGSLVAVSSLGAFQGMPRQPAYAASKAGVTSLTDSMAVELARYGIRANTVAPGWFDTEMTSEGLHDERFRERVLPRVPLRRWGSPDDIGGVAVYLASAARHYHTGDVLRIDGGYLKF